jgi:SAM-dependent methyltransferase
VTSVANEGETRRWNHPDWVAGWPKRERLTNAVTPFLLEVVDARSGQTVCDVGCGTGSLSLSLAEAVAPGGQVVGVDISTPLLELASRRASDSGCRNVRFVEMDMQTGDQEQGPFDLAVSQFGVMFFDEPLAALTAVRGRVRQGGRLVFACWADCERNPWHVGTALRSLLPPPKLPAPGKSPVGPFSFGDEEYVRELLGGAGFVEVRSVSRDLLARGPASAAVDRSLLSFMGVPPERDDEASRLLDDHLRQFEVGPDDYEYPLSFRIFDALNA